MLCIHSCCSISWFEEIEKPFRLSDLLAWSVPKRSLSFLSILKYRILNDDCLDLFSTKSFIIFSQDDSFEMLRHNRRILAASNTGLIWNYLTAAFYVFDILSRVANSWLDSWKNWLNHKRIIADAFVANFKMRSHAEIRGFVHYVSKSEYRSGCRVEKNETDRFNDLLLNRMTLLCLKFEFFVWNWTRSWIQSDSTKICFAIFINKNRYRLF